MKVDVIEVASQGTSGTARPLAQPAYSLIKGKLLLVKDEVLTALKKSLGKDYESESEKLFTARVFMKYLEALTIHYPNITNKSLSGQMAVCQYKSKEQLFNIAQSVCTSLKITWHLFHKPLL